jgi:hypothetical protein
MHGRISQWMFPGHAGETHLTQNRTFQSVIGSHEHRLLGTLSLHAVRIEPFVEMTEE